MVSLICLSPFHYFSSNDNLCAVWNPVKKRPPPPMWKEVFRNWRLFSLSFKWCRIQYGCQKFPVTCIVLMGYPMLVYNTVHVPACMSDWWPPTEVSLYSLCTFGLGAKNHDNFFMFIKCLFLTRGRAFEALLIQVPLLSKGCKTSTWTLNEHRHLRWTATQHWQGAYFNDDMLASLYNTIKSFTKSELVWHQVLFMCQTVVLQNAYSWHLSTGHRVFVVVQTF